MLVTALVVQVLVEMVFLGMIDYLLEGDCSLLGTDWLLLEIGHLVEDLKEHHKKIYVMNKRTNKNNEVLHTNITGIIL
jgi:hypothetical protein